MIAEQLKKSVLQAAIQGKLTQQLPEDGDARDLVKEIQKEKARLFREGKIKKEKPLPEIKEDEVPFDIPENWCWVRLEALSDSCDYPFADGPFGSNLKSEHYTIKHEVRIIQLSNIGENGWRDKNAKYTTYNHLKTIARSEVKAGDIVIAKMMPAGRAIEVPSFENKYVLSSDAIKFVPNRLINKSFILYAINSDSFRRQIYEDVHGITRTRTSLSKVKTYLIPLPPIAEQNRIVQRLNELLPQIDKLKSDEFRLDVLQRGFPKRLRASVLQCAVEGKLTEQLASDGDAHDLLEEIQKEKTRLIREGKIKKENPLPEIKENEIPFDIPENWCWVRLGEITTKIGSGSTPRGGKEVYQKSGIPFIRSQNVWNIGLRMDNVAHITEKIHEKMASTKIIEGDNLLNITGASIGRTCIVPKGFKEGNVSQHVSIVRSVDKRLNPFLHSILMSPYIQNKIMNIQVGISREGLSKKNMELFLIPVPPLAEQKRIVQRLEELLPEIEKLQQLAIH